MKLIYALEKYARKVDGKPTGEFGFAAYFLEETENLEGEKVVVGFKQPVSPEVASQLSKVPGYYELRTAVRSIDQKRIETILAAKLLQPAALFPSS